MLAEELLRIIRRLIVGYQTAPYAQVEKEIQALLPLLEKRSDEAVAAVETLGVELSNLYLPQVEHARLYNLINELIVEVAPIIGNDGKPIEPGKT